MFEGVAGIAAVTLTANRTAAAAPIPIAGSWSSPSAVNSAKQASSCSPQAASWAQRGDRAAARVAEYDAARGGP